jgi:hypothetical protein
MPHAGRIGGGDSRRFQERDMGPPHPRPDFGMLLHAEQWRLAGRDCAEGREDGECEGV